MHCSECAHINISQLRKAIGTNVKQKIPKHRYHKFYQDYFKPAMNNLKHFIK